ncbi:hypothetical protein K502DRAFT_324092 [Neoconidiobolus thromboides FSU 785]|nr:hypothetical protein K502DRAFT_324092 [Neoconidiobolus thromboides FSU 785]
MSNNNTTTSTEKCIICKTNDKKYKCPNCLINYCSVICFKVHKETPCIKVIEVKKRKLDENKTKAKIKLSESTIQKIREGLDEEDFIPVEEMENKLNSEELNKILKKDKVIEILNDILDYDDGSNPTKNAKKQIDLVSQIQQNFSTSLQNGIEHPLEELFQFLKK